LPIPNIASSNVSLGLRINVAEAEKTLLLSETRYYEFADPIHAVRDKEVARHPRPGGRFTLKSRRKLLKRDVAYENAGTVKISAFTERSAGFSPSQPFSRVRMLPFHVLRLLAGLRKELDRSCMIETDCGFHLAYPQCERAQVTLREKYLKPPAGMKEILARLAPTLLGFRARSYIFTS